MKKSKLNEKKINKLFQHVYHTFPKETTYEYGYAIMLLESLFEIHQYILTNGVPHEVTEETFNEFQVRYFASTYINELEHETEVITFLGIGTPLLLD